MSAKKAAALNTGYPIFGIKFIDDRTVLAVGGGGEGSNGVPNKITAVKCSLKVKDKDRKLQKFREITLPPNEDSPMCVDAARTIGDDGNKNLIFVGCNQSSALIKNMNVNNNLRKYGFSDEEHLLFMDAVQYENVILAETAGEYPKIISLSPESEVGAFMTSHMPSEISIFRPDSLELVAKIRASTQGEVRDFQISQDDGRFLCLVTSSTIEVINTATGRAESTSAQADKKTDKILARYNFSRLRFVSDTVVLVTGSYKSGKGVGIIRYDIINHKVIQESRVTKSKVVVVAMDVTQRQNLIALATNDINVTFIRLSDLKVVSTIPKLHKFALTSLSFSPSGTKLASGSASQTLNVMPIPPNYAKGPSFIWSFFKLFFFFFVIATGIFIQQAFLAGLLDLYVDRLEHYVGPIDHYVDLSKKHGGQMCDIAQKYGKVALDLSQKYGSEYYGKAQVYGKIGYEVLKDKSAYGIDLLKDKLNRDKLDDGDDTKQFFTMTNWEDNPDNLVETETATTTPQPNDTLRDFVSEVTKAVDELTKVEGDIDTDKIISEAVTLETDTLDNAIPSDEPASEEETVSEIPDVQSSAVIEEPVVETDTSEHEELAESTLVTPSVESSSVEQSESSVESTEEPESYAGTVLEDVREVEEPTGVPVEVELEDVPTHEAEFEKVEPEIIIEEEITPESNGTEEPRVPLNEFNEVEPVEADVKEPVDAAEVPEAAIPVATPNSDVTEIEDNSENNTGDETAILDSQEERVKKPIDEAAREVADEIQISEESETTKAASETEIDNVSEPLESIAETTSINTPEPGSVKSATAVSIIEPVETLPEIEETILSVEASTAESVRAPSAESVEVSPVSEPNVESEPVVLSSIVEPVESVVEPVIESVVEPDIESVVEPVIESVVEPVIESVVEPVIDPVIESVVEPIVEPSVDPEIDSALESAVESSEPASKPSESTDPVESVGTVSKTSVQSLETAIASEPLKAQQSDSTETASAQKVEEPVSLASEPASVDSQPASVDSQPAFVDSQPVSSVSESTITETEVPSSTASSSAEEVTSLVSSASELLDEAVAKVSLEVSSLKSSATAAHDEL